MEKKSIYKEPIFWLTIVITLALSYVLSWLISSIVPNLKLELTNSVLLLMDIVGGAGFWMVIFPKLFNQIKKVSTWLAGILFLLINIPIFVIFYYVYGSIFSIKTEDLASEFGLYFALLFSSMIILTFIKRKKKKS